MVQGTKINQVNGGGVTVSVWTAIDPPTGNGHHTNFKVDVGVAGDDYWVCVGGGGRGSQYLGNYLTASFPSSDFKSWNIHSRDHEDKDDSPLTGFAIGLKIPGLTKTELIEHLHIFQDPLPADLPTMPKMNHPERSCFIDDKFSMLVGGGFEIIDPEPPEKDYLQN